MPRNILNSSRILGVVSTKGGVGKTTTAINIGAAAVDMLDKNVLVFDTNLDSGDLCLNLGLTYNPISLFTITKNPVLLFNSIHKHKSGLHVIPSSLHNEQQIKPKDLRKNLDKLTSYDLILLDSAPGVRKDTELVMKSSDALLLVVTPDYPTVGSALRMVEKARKMNVPILGIVLNRVKNSKHEMKKKKIEATLGLPIISTIPEDSVVSNSIGVGMPAVIYKKRSPASISFKKLTAMLFGKKPKATFLSKVVEFFRV